MALHSGCSQTLLANSSFQQWRLLLRFNITLIFLGHKISFSDIFRRMWLCKLQIPARFIETSHICKGDVFRDVCDPPARQLTGSSRLTGAGVLTEQPPIKPSYLLLLCMHTTQSSHVSAFNRTRLLFDPTRSRACKKRLLLNVLLLYYS